MCDVLDRIKRKGIEKGMEQGEEIALLSSMKNLMEPLKLSAQQAMDALKIPPADRAKYAAKL